MRVTPIAVKSTSFSKTNHFVYLRAAFFAALAAAIAFATIGGCGSSATECKQGLIKPGDDCAKACTDGGGLLQDGACIAKCVPSDCLAGNTCVDNECKLQCTTFKDCNVGTQDCLPAKEDGTGKAIQTCQESNKAPFSTSCPMGTECAAILACPNGDSCNYTQCGGQACSVDKVACAGVDNCAIGVCADGKTACTVPGCPQSDCKPMTCVTKGQGDADAYCSIDDCGADSDCPSSYYCGIIHDPHDICNSTMDTDQEKGNNNFCGTTTDACIAPGDFKKDGHTFFEGSVCLLRHACIERKQCDPCTFDGACENLPGGQCADVAGSKRCVASCDKDTDCQPDYKCDDRKLCIPRFAGGCVGTGKFCEPCQNDQDCGDASTRKACVPASRNQHACEDLALPTTCAKDADCGTDSTGDHFHCWGEFGTPHEVVKLSESAGELPEGLLIKNTRTFLVSYAAKGEIVSIDTANNNKVTQFATGPDTAGGVNGYYLGLAANPKTNEIYFGVASFNPVALQAGIYKVPATGGAATLVASDAGMTFPNGLVFDTATPPNLYVTDSASGTIFKVVGSVVTPWITDPSLAPPATHCTPDTPVAIGANGIFLRGSGSTAAIFVSNTNAGSIIKVPIDSMTGLAGTPATIAGPSCADLGGIDGIFDNGSSILAALNTQNAIVSVSYTSGTVSTVTKGGPLNGPATIVQQQLYGTQLVITNSDFLKGAGGPSILTMIFDDDCSPGTQCGAYHTCQACDGDVDCPTSPSGLHGHCAGTPWNGDDTALTGSGMLPADECVPLLYQGQIYCDSYKSCGLPIADLSNLQSGCWPAPAAGN